MSLALYARTLLCAILSQVVPEQMNLLEQN